MLLVTELPIEAGVLLEAGRSPTLVVKSTWVPGDDGARLAPVQLPLTRSIAHPDGIHLYYPSDFVPAKPRLDLCACGLRSDGRSTPFVVAVDDWYRRFRTFQPAEAEIAEAAMHTPEGEIFTRLAPVDAPMASYRARRWQFADAALSLPLRPMPRTVRIEAGLTMVTWSWREALQLSTRGPDGNLRDVSLACDTIFADASTRTLVLLHRAELGPRLPAEVFVIARSVGAAGPPSPPRDRAGTSIAEYEVSYVDAAPYRAQNGWSRAATPRETAKLDSHRTFDHELPFGRGSAPAITVGPSSTTVVRSPAPSSATLVNPPAAAPPPPAPRVASPPRFDPNATIPATVSPLASAQATPFRPRAPYPPAPPPPANPAYPPPPVEPPPASRPPASYPPPPPAVRRESVPIIDTPAPAPAAPPAMSLDDYARVRARLTAGDDLDTALSGLGFEAAAYGAVDRSVAQELAREARLGQNDLAQRLKQLVRKASADRA